MTRGSFGIYKDEHFYSSFPHVVRLPDGRLALVFRRAGKFSVKAAIQGNVTHHDPDSAILMTYSSDEGLTWTTPVVVYDSAYGVNDPALTVLSDGSLLLRFVVLMITKTEFANEIGDRPIFSHRVEHGLVSTVLGNMIMKSEDSGDSWSELGISYPQGIVGDCSRDPIVEMEDRSLLMPVYNGSPQRTEVSWVVRSFDGGVTWNNPSIVMIDPAGEHSQQHGINYSETSLVNFGGGALLAITRADETFYTGDGSFVAVGGLGELRSSRSLDGGLSWTLPAKTGIYGTPGSVCRLEDGRLLLSYGYRREDFGVRCRISSDFGQTWSKNEIVITKDAPSWDCGYPNSIELGDGKILTVYYQSDESGIRHIRGKIWSIQ